MDRQFLCDFSKKYIKILLFSAINEICLKENVKTSNKYV